MKLIVDVDEKLVREGFERPFTEEERNILIRAIGNGTPYNPTGDLINYEDLKKVLTSETRNKFEFVCLNYILEKIDNAPRYEQEVYLDETSFNHYIEGYREARKVFERQKGEWIFDTEVTEFGNPYGTYRCSICGGHSSDKYSFCKDCGADMRGEEDEAQDESQ